MHNFWRSAAQCLVASLALVLLTAVFYQLHLNLATVGLLYVIVVVLLSRFGSFASSIVASMVAVLCLAHLAPPAFSFRVDDPLDEVAIAAFLVTSLTIASLVSRVRKQAEDALSSVTYRVIEAEEQERQRIAKDLHEGIGQRLTLLTLEIEELNVLNAVDVPRQIDVVRKRGLEILADAKILAHELHSPSLEYFGVAEGMKGFCREFGEQNGMEIDFKSEDLPGLVPPDISLCLFRILQEALHNAVKHSGVRQLDVQLKGTSDEIHLRIIDHGVGFIPEIAKASAGLGLNHMQERLKLVKGNLSIDSQPNRGTTIHAHVPLSRGSDSGRVAGRRLL